MNNLVKFYVGFGLIGVGLMIAGLVGDAFEVSFEKHVFNEYPRFGHIQMMLVTGLYGAALSFLDYFELGSSHIDFPTYRAFPSKTLLGISLVGSVQYSLCSLNTLIFFEGLL